MNTSARCRYRTGKPGDNLTDLAILDLRLEGNEGHSALARIGASYKVELSAGRGELVTVYILRVASLCQVHLDGRIHRHHVVVLSNHRGVIHVTYRVAFDRDVFMQEIEESLVSHCEGEYSLSRNHFLPSIGDNSVLNQACQGGVAHLCFSLNVVCASEQREFLGGGRELVAKVWMRKPNQSLRALCRRLALHVSPAELRDYDVGVGSRRGHRALQSGDDARHFALRRGRLTCDERLAAPRSVGAPHEVKLAPCGAVLVAEHVLRVDGT